MVPFGSLEVTLMAIRFEPPLERISVPETGLVEHQPGVETTTGVAVR